MDLETGLNSPKKNNNTIVRPYLGPRPNIYRADATNDFLNNGSSIACLCLFAIIIIGLSITYIVFIITALIDTSYDTVKNTCPGSSLWLYLLLSLILGLGLSASTTKCIKSDDKCIQIIGNLFAMVFSIGLMVWGLLEIVNNKCIINLDDTLLYKMGFATMIMQGFSTIINLCVLFVKVMCNQI